MIALEQITGVVLCRVGGARLAFAARDVTALDRWIGGGKVPHAGAAFGEPPHYAEARVLLAPQGEGVVVEALEIHDEPLPLLAPPGVLANGCGGSLTGFVVARSTLWPVLRLVEFSRFLSGGKGA